jgi:hypothetical protein
MPPLALSSFFYPTFEDGAAVFNGEGDPDSNLNIKPSSVTGRELLEKLSGLVGSCHLMLATVLLCPYICLIEG